MTEIVLTPEDFEVDTSNMVTDADTKPIHPVYMTSGDSVFENGLWRKMNRVTKKISPPAETPVIPKLKMQDPRSISLSMDEVNPPPGPSRIENELQAMASPDFAPGSGTLFNKLSRPEVSEQQLAKEALSGISTPAKAVADATKISAIETGKFINSPPTELQQADAFSGYTKALGDVPDFFLQGAGNIGGYLGSLNPDYSPEVHRAKLHLMDVTLKALNAKKLGKRTDISYDEDPRSLDDKVREAQAAYEKARYVDGKTYPHLPDRLTKAGDVMGEYAETKNAARLAAMTPDEKDAYQAVSFALNLPIEGVSAVFAELRNRGIVSEDTEFWAPWVTGALLTLTGLKSKPLERTSHRIIQDKQIFPKPGEAIVTGVTEKDRSRKVDFELTKEEVANPEKVKPVESVVETTPEPVKPVEPIVEPIVETPPNTYSLGPGTRYTYDEKTGQWFDGGGKKIDPSLKDLIKRLEEKRAESKVIEIPAEEVRVVEEPPLEVEPTIEVDPKTITPIEEPLKVDPATITPEEQAKELSPDDVEISIQPEEVKVVDESTLLKNSTRLEEKEVGEIVPTEEPLTGREVDLGIVEETGRKLLGWVEKKLLPAPVEEVAKQTVAETAPQIEKIGPIKRIRKKKEQEPKPAQELTINDKLYQLDENQWYEKRKVGRVKVTDSEKIDFLNEKLADKMLEEPVVEVPKETREKLSANGMKERLQRIAESAERKRRESGKIEDATKWEMPKKEDIVSLDELREIEERGGRRTTDYEGTWDSGIGDDFDGPLVFGAADPIGAVIAALIKTGGKWKVSFKNAEKIIAGVTKFNTTKEGKEFVKNNTVIFPTDNLASLTARVITNSIKAEADALKKTVKFSGKAVVVDSLPEEHKKLFPRKKTVEFIDVLDKIQDKKTEFPTDINHANSLFSEMQKLLTLKEILINEDFRNMSHQERLNVVNEAYNNKEISLGQYNNIVKLLNIFSDSDAMLSFERGLRSDGAYSPFYNKVRIKSGSSAADTVAAHEFIHAESSGNYGLSLIAYKQYMEKLLSGELNRTTESTYGMTSSAEWLSKMAEKVAGEFFTVSDQVALQDVVGEAVAKVIGDETVVQILSKIFDKDNIARWESELLPDWRIIGVDPILLVTGGKANEAGIITNYRKRYTEGRRAQELADETKSGIGNKLVSSMLGLDETNTAGSPTNRIFKTAERFSAQVNKLYSIILNRRDTQKVKTILQDTEKLLSDIGNTKEDLAYISRIIADTVWGATRSSRDLIPNTSLGKRLIKEGYLSEELMATSKTADTLKGVTIEGRSVGVTLFAATPEMLLLEAVYKLTKRALGSGQLTANDAIILASIRDRVYHNYGGDFAAFSADYKLSPQMSQGLQHALTVFDPVISGISGVTPTSMGGKNLTGAPIVGLYKGELGPAVNFRVTEDPATGKLVYSDPITLEQVRDLSLSKADPVFNLPKGGVRRGPNAGTVVGNVEFLLKKGSYRVKSLVNWLTKIHTTSDRAIQSLGPYWKEMYHKVKKAEGDITRISDDIYNRLKKPVEDLGPHWQRQQSLTRIGIHALAQEGSEGLARLKITGVDINNLPQLTPKELAAYQQIRTVMEDMYKRTNEARRRVGLPDVPYVGNYFTFVTDVALAADKGFNVASWGNNGMTNFKNRAIATANSPYNLPRTNQALPVELNAMKVLESYLNKQLRFINLAPIYTEAHLAFGTKYKGPTGKARAFITHNPQAYNVGASWLNALQGFPKETTAGHWWATKLSNNVASAVCSFALRTGVVQPLSLIYTVAEIGARNTIYGISKVLADTITGRKALKVAKVESDSLINRQYESAFEGFAKTLTEGPVESSLEQIKKAGRWFTDLTDGISAHATYEGAKRMALKKGATHGEAARFADSVVAKTQGSGAVSDRSPVQWTALGKFLTTLQTFTINNLNYIVKDVAAVGFKGDPKTALSRAYKIMIGTVLANYLYTEYLGIPDPVPDPVTAFYKAMKATNSVSSAAHAAAGEVVEFLPYVGGTPKYGEPPGGIVTQTVWQMLLALADRTKFGTRAKADPMDIVDSWYYRLGKSAATLGGVRGVRQVDKIITGQEKGATAWESLMGRMPKEEREQKKRKDSVIRYK